jgi:two-component system sensor histidine kinase KdpD
MIRLAVLDAGRGEAHLASMAGLPADQHSAAEQMRGLAIALLMVAGSTLLGLAIAPRWGNSAVDLLYLPAVIAAALIAGRGAALLSALASALAYNFFFTAPHLTFRIDNPNDIATFFVLFAVAVVTSHLAASVRKQAQRAESHAERNATIAGLARQLLSCTSEQDVADVSTREIARLFDCNAALLSGRPGQMMLSSAPGPVQLTPNDSATAALVAETGVRAGRGVDRAVPTEWQFHPIKSGETVLAIMSLARDDGVPAVSGDRLPLLDSLLDQAALALERSRLEGEAQEFVRSRERDQVRSVLLSSIGGDLRPRLAAITRAVRALRRNGSADKELVSAVESEASKMDRYLANLSDLGSDDDREPVQVGPVIIDLFKRAVLRDGEEIHLTPKEFSILAELAKHPGRVLTHAHLLRTAWGPAQEHQTEYLRVAVRALRQKLERDPSRPEFIINEPAVGYRLRAGG